MIACIIFSKISFFYSCTNSVLANTIYIHKLIHCQNPYIKSCFSKKEVSRAPLCCPCIQEKEDDDDEEGEENVILEISFL